MARKGKIGEGWHCALCGCHIPKALYLEKLGKRLSASFCCMEHYKKFWAKTPGFIPLPEYKKNKGAK